MSTVRQFSPKVVFGVVLCLWVSSGLQASDVPKWLRAAAAQPVAAETMDVPAKVLLNETVLTIDEQGRASWRHRYVVKILTAAGTPEAFGGVSYLDKKDKVRSADAWLLRGEKAVRQESDDKWFDWSAAPEGALFDETRAKEISFRDNAVAGDIFASDTTVVGPMLFNQDIYTWENPLPTTTERYVVSVPAGWSVRSVVRGDVLPVASATPDKLTWTWETRDRSYRPLEPWTDQHCKVEARVMVNLVPPAGTKASAFKIFGTWAEVAEWQQNLADGQCDVDPALSAKARQLAADCPTVLEKIRALAGYVQKLRYVALNRNLARGMGYRPRKASEVYAKGFGDCKDKSNLLRAMLREVGITAFPVIALSSMERGVEGDWPSPYQFNHMILAIQVDSALSLPTVISTQPWGSLLFFDSTDPETLVGDLPWYLQGSNVLVLAPGSEELVRLPELPTDRCWLGKRLVQLALKDNGTVSGECHLTGFAQEGAGLRRSVHNMSVKELHTWATDHINSSIRGATAQEVAYEDDAVTGRFSVNFGFTAPTFAQVMPGGLSVVRLDLLDHGSIPTFAENTRRTPVRVRSLIQDDEINLELPPGVAVEELPDKTVLKGSFGSYESFYETRNGSIGFHRILKLSPQVVPAADYAKLRQFLTSISKADRGAVVLRSGN